MAETADHIIDRRRLRRKLTLWRSFTFLALLALVAAIAGFVARDFGGDQGRDHIAQLRIEGAIVEDDELLERIEKIRKSDAVKGVIVTIDSPGGTTAGGEAIFVALRKLAADKPMVSQVGTLAASAGYMIASASDHIIARQSSIVGSIGVLFQYPDVSGLLDKVGVKVESIKSSPMKAEPSIFGNAPEESKQMIRAMILDSFDWFKNLVDERRPLDRAEVDRLADGSIFTGRKALDLKLVDALGGRDEAKAWLVGKGVDADLDIVEWKKKATPSNLLLARAGFGWLAGLFGIDAGLASALAEQAADRVALDGLVSVWHVEQPVAGQ
ncbi:MAG TPA: signal peptide peptidase SppA [Rhizobiaceae bacterium]|nr:signal peptide peptidase SppA [Rhizobiaceae bacterium]